MKQNRNVDFKPVSHEWDDVNLIISDEVLADMEKKFISATDLKEAIWLAESSGDKFYDENDGMFMCSMVKPVITYWVQYKATAPKTYEIFKAYYHRMRIDREEKRG